jgi:hypothetical protein
MGGRAGAGCRPVAGGQNRAHPGGVPASRSALGESPYDRPNHVVEEATGCYLDPDQLAARLNLQPPKDSHRALAGRRGAERPEVAFADEGRSSGLHRFQIEPLRLMIGIARQQRAALRTVENGVDVGALAGREASREVVADHRCIARRAIRRQRSAQRKQKSLERKARLGCERNDLPAGMNAAVGAPRAGYFYRFAKEPRKRAFQYARDRARLRLPLESAKIGAVVLDGQAKIRQRFARRSSAFAAAKSC